MAVCSTAMLFIVGVAVQDLSAGEPAVYLGIEHFSWKEFDGTAQIFNESGPLYDVGFTYRGGIGDEGSALTLTPRIEFFWGDVDYGGQACRIAGGGCLPINNDTGYLGFKLEFDVGGRFGKGFSIEPFAGIGYREWWRDRQDAGVSYSNAPDANYSENWEMIYGRVGVRGDVNLSRESKMFFEAVGRIPIANENTVHLNWLDIAYDVTMEPGRMVTLFAEAGVKLRVFRMSVFYETLRFSESTHVYTYALGLTFENWQPRSEADLYGVRIGASF